MTHRLTHAFATVLANKPEDFEATAQAIEDLTGGYSDEHKADLYALIHEAVNQDMAFVELADTIDRCLKKSDARFLRG